MKRFKTKMAVWPMIRLPLSVSTALAVAAATVCLLQAQRNYPALVLCLILYVLFASRLVSMFFKRNTRLISLEGDELYLYNAHRGKSYAVSGASASDFIIRQSRHDAHKNRCTVEIRGTHLRLKAVENCTGLQKHINDNFHETGKTPTVDEIDRAKYL